MDDKKQYVRPALFGGSVLLTGGNDPIGGMSGESGGFEPELSNDDEDL